MSANRAVQAAQRRRAGPPEPSPPGKSMPQPSINSAQMFSGQNRQQQQQQGRQQQQQQIPTQQSAGGALNSVNKMTIPQAITLITLRLGSLETKMIQLETSGGVSMYEGHDHSDNGVIQSIMERLDIIEKRLVEGVPTSNSSVSNSEVQILKQQFETVKQSVIQSKGISSAIVNENRTLKNQIDGFKQELVSTKELVTTLQNLALENSQKILELTINPSGEQFLDLPIEDVENDEYVEEDDTITVETNLKELIESEINAST
jgi:hypothetical protein